MGVDDFSYRKYHEQYMEHHSGTGPLEIIILLSCFIGLVFLCSYWNRLYSSKRSLLVNALIRFCVDFSLIVLPIILLVTVLNIYSLMFLFAVILSFVIINLKVISSTAKPVHEKLLQTVCPPGKRAFITYYRSLISLISGICILAVDFTIFPRDLAKTETFGFSLMDTGVGFFVVANGITVKHHKSGVVKTALSCLPILILGGVRMLSVDNLNYQKHVSEYGTDWNFFFTLAFVKLFGLLVIQVWPHSPGIVGIVIALTHQMALSSGFQDWVLSDVPRTDFITSNREGLFSLPGYVVLFLCSVELGRRFHGYSSRTVKSELFDALKIFAFGAALILTTVLLEDWVNISRRLANLTYVTWIFGSSLILLCFCICVEALLKLSTLHAKEKSSIALVPDLLEAVSFNGLLFFILSNLLTGLINLSIKTLYVAPVNSLFIIIAYSFVSCFTMQLFFLFNVQVKFW